MASRFHCSKWRADVWSGSWGVFGVPRQTGHPILVHHGQTLSVYGTEKLSCMLTPAARQLCSAPELTCERDPARQMSKLYIEHACLSIAACYPR